MGRRGVGAVSFLREQLASTDMDVPHVGLSTLRDEGGGTPRDECGISYREYGAGVYSPAGNDRSAVEECAGGREPRFFGTLDAAYAGAGRFEEAISTANKARELALVAGQPQIAQKAEERLALYREGKPYHSPPPNP